MISHYPIILLKITRKEYIKSIVEKGHFHFTQASYFRENALRNSDSLIFDINECSIPRNRIVYLENNKTKERIKLFDNNNGHIALEANQCLFCTYAPNNADLFTSGNTDNTCYKMKIPKELISEICDGNPIEEYAIIIFEYPFETIRRINELFKSKKITGAAGRITYDDHFFNISDDPRSINNAIECAFHKQKKFSNQQEFRIVALNSKKEDLTSVNIGPLEKDEYSIHDIIENKDFQISIYPYINRRLSETSVEISLDHIETEWI